MTIVDAVASDTRFSIFRTAVDRAGLTPTLAQESTITLFAPTDAAFANLPAGMVDMLYDHPVVLKRILHYHLAPGSICREKAALSISTPSIAGLDLSVRLVEGTMMVNRARVLETVPATNGLVHAIDAVLIPSI